VARIWRGTGARASDQLARYVPAALTPVNQTTTATSNSAAIQRFAVFFTITQNGVRDSCQIEKPRRI